MLHGQQVFLDDEALVPVLLQFLPGEDTLRVRAPPGLHDGTVIDRCCPFAHLESVQGTLRSIVWYSTGDQKLYNLLRPFDGSPSPLQFAKRHLLPYFCNNRNVSRMRDRSSKFSRLEPAEVRIVNTPTLVMLLHAPDPPTISSLYRTTDRMSKITDTFSVLLELAHRIHLYVG